MNTHPSIEDLFAAASAAGTSPGGQRPEDVVAHVERCLACRTKLDRLKVGAALLEEARTRPSLAPRMRWDAIDSAIQRESVRVASGIREGTHRIPRQRLSLPALGGLVLAAAAGVALVFRLQHPAEVVIPVPGAHVGPVVAVTPAVVAPSVVAADERAPYEGTVLLAAGGAQYHEARGGASEHLAGVRVLREGSRIETASAGRAVVQVQPGWRLDVRPDAAVSLARLRTGEATLALDHGEVAFRPDGAMDPGTRVSVQAGPWEVTARGAMVARAELGVVRVVVLGAHVDVRRDGGDAVEYTGPIELELPDTTGVPRVVARDAHDSRALDAAVMAGSGRLYALPAIDPAATLMVPDHGALPSGLEAIRVDHPLTIRARVGHTLMALEVGSGRPLEWVRVGTPTAVATAGANRPVQPRPAPVAAAPPGPELSPVALRAIESRVRARLNHCIDTCVEQNRCRGEQLHGQITFHIDDQGRVAGVVVDPSAAGARSCLENDARFLAFPPGALNEFGMPIGRRP